jgi:replicative DNA helicase
VEKLLPQNIEAEQGVLGSLILDPEVIEVLSGKVQAHDFYRDAHKQIFGAIERLYEQKRPADFITLCDELERWGTLVDVGGASYITSLINCVPTSGNAEYYAMIVAEFSQLRDTVHACGQIAAEVYEPGAEADEVLSNAQQKFFEIAMRRQRGNGFTATGTIMDDRITRLEYLHNHRGAIIGVPTGFGDLDQMTGGLQRSDLIILAARPGIGKTSLAMNMAANAALRHMQHVAVFSLEMSKEQLGDRLLSTEAGVDQQRMRTGWIEEDEWGRIVEASDRIAEASLWIDDTAGITPTQMRTKARRLQATMCVDLIIVDYLQLMRTGSSKKYENRVQEVSEISRSLKGLARELNVPVLALSQLSRSVESRAVKVPQLSDLRESGSIEQDSDIVMFIYRDDVYNPESERKNIADLIVAKHRNGPVGELSLGFDPTQTRFKNLGR